MKIDIQISDNAIDTYKNLLIRRDSLKKESELIWLSYVREFGNLIETLYKVKVDCIALKKKIAFCQAKQNRNEQIYLSDMEYSIEIELTDYYEEIKYIQEIRKSEGRPISDYEFLQIKKLYRKIATMIHPDLHHELFQEKEIQELWNQAKNAYDSNDYPKLKEIKFLISEAIKKYTNIVIEYNIENLDERIDALREEINKITTTDPYKYKFILENNELILEEKNQLKDEIDFYQKYIEELKETLSKFTIIEVLN